MKVPKKRAKQPETGDSCAELLSRVQKLERAFKELTGLSIEQVSESHETPVKEEHRYDSSVVRIHQDGKVEYKRICPYCQAETGDLQTHKSLCPKRPSI